MNTFVGSGFSVPYAESVLVIFVGGRELLFMKIIKERTSKVESRLDVMAKTILSYVLMLLT